MKSKQKTFLSVLFVALLVYVVVTFFGLTELDQDGRLGLTVLIFAGGLWVLEPLPLQVTGLIIPVCLVGTGILGIEEAFHPFASPVVFLILGSLFLAEALRKHGLTRRLALDLIVRCNGRPKLVLLAIMAVAGFTSMWIFSTAVVAMLMPVCLTIARKVEEENRDEFVTVLLMALVIGSTLGALGTILGASSNAVASGILANERTWSFLDWMKYGAPLAFFFVVVSWGIMISGFYPDIKRIDTDVVQSELQEQGPLTPSEHGIFYVLFTAIILWVLGPYLNPYLGIPSDLTESAIISLCAAGTLFALDIITWPDARQVNWGIYLIIGAGLSLGKGLLESGVSSWFARSVTGFVGEFPYVVMAAVLITVTAIVSNTVNNTTVVAILAPVMADAAVELPFTVTQLMLPMAFGATFGFFLPSASSRMALIYASDEIETSEMIKIGSVITGPLIVLTTLYFYLLYQMGLI